MKNDLLTLFSLLSFSFLFLLFFIYFFVVVVVVYLDNEFCRLLPGPFVVI